MRKELKFSELAGFQPKQLEFDKAVWKNKYIFCGGSAGSGKSYFLRWEAIKLLLYYAGKYKLSGVRVGLFCEDYPALKDRHLAKIQFELPAWLGSYNKSDHDFTLNKEFGSGVISFRNLDDPSKYLSSEFAAICVDELTKNPREMFDFLSMRLRWPGISDPKFIGASNPGGAGHGWVKKLWIDRDFSGETFDPTEFTFVPAKYSDNKYLDKSYEKQLASLPEKLRKAYMDGDWNVFAGQFFSEFRTGLHTCEPFEVPETWQTVIGLDYGYAKPSAAMWIAYDQAFDTFYITREIYGIGKTYADFAQEIGAVEDRCRLIIADPAIFAKKDSPNSGASEMLKVLKDYKIYPANNDRVIGWGRLREALQTYEMNGEKKAKLRIFNTCKNLIRTLPELVYSDIKTKVEDLDSDSDDHCADATRYGIMYFKNKKIQNKAISYDLGEKKDKTFDFDVFSDKIDEDKMFEF